MQHYANEAARVVCKTCASLIGRPVILFDFISAQSGKILGQFLCKSFILFYFNLLQKANRFTSMIYVPLCQRAPILALCPCV